jgi:adenylate kinase
MKVNSVSSIGAMCLIGGLALFQNCLAEEKTTSDKTISDAKDVTMEVKKEKTVKVLSMFGPPGCGKGTVASQLVKDFGFVTLSTGDLCRYHIKNQTEIGKTLKAVVEKGHLAPDELITDMVVEWLKEQVKTAKNIILDGYPRTKEQAELFDKHLKEDAEFKNIEFVVVDFDVDSEEIVKRISSRVVCPNKSCQKVYNTLALKPKVDMVCDECGTKLIRRADDEEKVVRERLKVFAGFKKNILDFYNTSGSKVLAFEPKGTPQEVFENFKKIL